MALAMYDPSSVYINAAGVIEVEDVSEGTFIEITKDAALFSSVVSTDGKTYRVKIPNDNYTVTISLSSSSKSSKVLQYLSVADQFTGLAQFPLFIKDISGSSFFFATSCWIESQPTMSFSNSTSALVWTIKATQAVISFGDNYGSSSAVDDVINGIIASLPSLKGLIE